MYISTQPHLTPRQIRQIELLAKYDFEIIYQSGSQNKAADALSRRFDYEETLGIKEISTVKSEFFQAWILFYQKDAALKLAYDLAKSHPEQVKDFQIINGLLRLKCKLCVLSGLPRESILREHHDAPIPGWASRY
jgi:hypothetical protein